MTTTRKTRPKAAKPVSYPLGDNPAPVTICDGCGRAVATKTTWRWAGERLCPKCYWTMRVHEEGE